MRSRYVNSATTNAVGPSGSVEAADADAEVPELDFDESEEEAGVRFTTKCRTR